MEQGGSRFLTLADELLIEIITQIDDRTSLCSLALVSSRLQGLTEPYIYESIMVRTGSEARNLIKVFDSRDSLLRAVKDLQIRYRYEVEEGIEALNPFLERLEQLRHLRIETPCCNDSPWHGRLESWKSSGVGGKLEHTRLFEQAVALPDSINPIILGQLRSVTLHAHGNGQGSSRFDLGKNVAIFLLPNVRSITLSCFDVGINADIQATLSKFDRYNNSAKSTALESLVFDECNISFKGIQVLLGIPKALERLTLGERIYHTSDDHVPLGFDLCFLEALELQIDSIKYLKHIGGGMYWSEAGGAMETVYNLTSLRNLEVVELGETIYDKYAEHLSSPNLRTVRFLQVSLGLDQGFFFWLIQTPKFSKTGSLHHLDLVLANSQSHTQAFWREFWAVEFNRTMVDILATRLRKHQTQLRIYKFKQTEQSYCPPYMYGEELPEEKLVYISSTPNQFDGQIYEILREEVVDVEEEEEWEDEDMDVDDVLAIDLLHQ